MQGNIDNNRDKIGIKLKIFYGIILLICIVAIIMAIYLQIKKDKKTKQQISQNQTKQEQTTTEKEEFDNIFKNKVNYLKNNSYKINKIEQDKEIIYIGYQNQESKINDYELNVNIPYINIQNETIEKYNQEIAETFEKKAKSVLNIKNNDIVYTVNYSAYVTNNILSLVIKSTLKEGNSPQRNIIQTYNFDLTNQKEYTIQEMLELREITKQQANQKIREEIKKVQENVEELAKLGYSIYSRDIDNDMYTVNNITEYFIGQDNKIYIIFAYGNTSNTSEMDIVTL